MRRGSIFTEEAAMMTSEQIEILMLDSAVDSQRMCVARMKRREVIAIAERAQAEDDLRDMQAKLQYMRESLLLKGCV